MKHNKYLLNTYKKIDKRKLIAVVLVIWTVVFDALRDCFINNPNWLLRHTFKWLAFYPLPAFVIWTHLGWQWIIYLAPVCWAIWQLTARYLGKKQWESWIVRLIKRIF